MRVHQVSWSTTYDIIHSGFLKSHKVGRLIRITAEDLQQFIEHRPMKPKKAAQI